MNQYIEEICGIAARQPEGLMIEEPGPNGLPEKTLRSLAKTMAEYANHKKGPREAFFASPKEKALLEQVWFGALVNLKREAVLCSDGPISKSIYNAVSFAIATTAEGIARNLVPEIDTAECVQHPLERIGETYWNYLEAREKERRLCEEQQKASRPAKKKEERDR